MGLYRLHPVTIGSAVIDCITEVTFSDQVTVAKPIVDGELDNSIALIMGRSPMGSFTTHNLADALDVFEIGSVEDTADLYDALIDDDGTKSSTGAIRYQFGANSLVFPVSINCAQDQPAALVAQIHAAAAVTKSSGSLGAYTPGGDTYFALGPTSINGTALSQITNVSLTFGLTPIVKRADGDIYPQLVRLQSRLARVAITTLNSAHGPTYNGLALNGTTGMRLYFRKKSALGYVANNVSEHILFSVANGLVHTESTTGVPRQTTIIIEPNGPLSLDTTAAVT